MSMILLVRSEDEMDSCIQEANKFLIYRRQGVDVPGMVGETNEILGIWVDRDLGEGLPSCISGDRHINAANGGAFTANGNSSRSGTSEATLRVHESFALSGFWTLCLWDGSLLRTERSPAVRRNKILAVLLGSIAKSEPHDKVGCFFPVFDASDTSQFIGKTLRQLQLDFPHIVSGACYIHDPKGGIVDARRIDRGELP